MGELDCTETALVWLGAVDPAVTVADSLDDVHNMGWTRPIDSGATPSVRFAASGVQDLDSGSSQVIPVLGRRRERLMDIDHGVEVFGPLAYRKSTGTR